MASTWKNASLHVFMLKIDIPQPPQPHSSALSTFAHDCRTHNFSISKTVKTIKHALAHQIPICPQPARPHLILPPPPRCQWTAFVPPALHGAHCSISVTFPGNQPHVVPPNCQSKPSKASQRSHDKVSSIEHQVKVEVGWDVAFIDGHDKAPQVWCRLGWGSAPTPNHQGF